MERQREIEIYLRDCPLDRLVTWLESVVGPLAPVEAGGAALVYRSSIGPIVVTQGIEGGPFVGVWFNSPNTPWATDVDCARQAARELERVVRCCPGPDFPDVPCWVADQFLEIAGGMEQIVTGEYTEEDAAVDGRCD